MSDAAHRQEHCDAVIFDLGGVVMESPLHAIARYERDDIGRNLKTARALRMTTIKVDDPDLALSELAELLGFDLLA